MTEEDFLSLRKGDIVIVIESIHIESIDHFSNESIPLIEVGEELWFSEKHWLYPGQEVYNFFRKKEGTPTGWVISHLTINAHNHLIRKKVLERDNKIKQILS